MDLETTNRLIELRKLHGYSQEDLAAKLGVSRQAISKWERGEASPDTDNLIALARLYDISLDELLSVKPSGRKSTEDEESFFDDQGEKYSSDSYTNENNSGFNFNSDGSSVHIGKGGVHVKDGKDGDEVHIGWDGIHISGKDKKESSPINFTFNSYDDKKDKDNNQYTININDKNKEKKEDKDDRSLYEKIVDSVSGVICIAAYLVLGCVYDMWHPGWIIFLLFPVLPAIICPKKWEGIFPVLVCGIYLCLGFYLNAWHPGWIIFLSIPVFYTIWNTVKSVILAKKQKIK